MYHLQYYDKSQLLGLFEYPDLKEAKNAIKENDVYNASTRYKITEVATGNVVAEADFEANPDFFQNINHEDDLPAGFETGGEDFYQDPD